jgi:catechol 2,3-dioxygenase-like lactoylglutathione lyase family enzyme
MIDHIEIFVSDGAGSRAFYDQVLKPLGIEVKREVSARVKALGYGDDARGPFFWVTPIGTPCFLLAFSVAPSRSNSAMALALASASLARWCTSDDLHVYRMRPIGGMIWGAPGPLNQPVALFKEIQI